MLGLLGVILSFVFSFLVFAIAIRVGERTPNSIVIGSIAFPASIYVLLAYILGQGYIPGGILNLVVVLMAGSAIGANVGRMIVISPLIEEVKMDLKSRQRVIVILAFTETGPIFALLVFLLGWSAFMNNDWSFVVSPYAFVLGMEFLTISVMIGGVLSGLFIRYGLQRIREEGKELRGQGFAKALIYTSIPHPLYILGLLLMILSYMGELAL